MWRPPLTGFRRTRALGKRQFWSRTCLKWGDRTSALPVAAGTRWRLGCFRPQHSFVRAVTHRELRPPSFHEAETPKLRKLAHNYRLAKQAAPSQSYAWQKHPSEWDSCSERWLLTPWRSLATPSFSFQWVSRTSRAFRVLFETELALTKVIARQGCT